IVIPHDGRYSTGPYTGRTYGLSTVVPDIILDGEQGDARGACSLRKEDTTNPRILRPSVESAEGVIIKGQVTHDPDAKDLSNARRFRLAVRFGSVVKEDVAVEIPICRD